MKMRSGRLDIDAHLIAEKSKIIPPGNQQITGRDISDRLKRRSAGLK